MVLAPADNVSEVNEIVFGVLVEIDVEIVVPMVVICVDDNRREELSVELKTLFIAVVSTSVIDDDAAVSVEVVYEFDVGDNDEYSTDADVSSMVFSVFTIVELETSFVVEMV